MTDLFLMFRDSIDFVMDLTYIEVWGISVFEVALLGFLAFSLFRFIINPLIGVGGSSWNLSTLNDISDNVKTSNENQNKKYYYGQDWFKK